MCPLSLSLFLPLSSLFISRTVRPVVARREELALVELAGLERSVGATFGVVICADAVAAQVAVPVFWGVAIFEEEERRTSAG